MSRRSVQRRRIMRQARRAERGLEDILPRPNHPRDDCHTHVKRVNDKGSVTFNNPQPGSRRGTNPITEHAMALWAADWKRGTK